MARAGRFESRYDLVLLAGCAFLGFFVRALPEHLRDPMASTIRRTVLAPLVSLQRQAELTRGALDTYENRTIALDSLALQAMEARSLAAENDALRSLLALGARLRWGFTPAEALTGASAADQYTLTLTVGQRAGIKEKSPVVAPEGLVGMVQTVEPTMSIAIIWPHPEFRVSAMDVDGNAFGIVQAHRDQDSYLLELRNVAYRSELAPGTLIVSSGLGGVYPKGIPIGTVLSEIESPEGWTRTYVLLPAVRPQDVRSVMVLDPQRANEGVQSVWARPASRDSVTRRIASASDSIARRLAQAEAARQRADSIARLEAGELPDPRAAEAGSDPLAHQQALREPTTTRQPQTTPSRPTVPRQQGTTSAQRDSSTGVGNTNRGGAAGAPMGAAPRRDSGAAGAAPRRDTGAAGAPTPRRDTGAGAATPPRRDSNVAPGAAGARDSATRPADTLTRPRPDSTRPDAVRPDSTGPDSARRTPPVPPVVPPPDTIPPRESR